MEEQFRNFLYVQDVTKGIVYKILATQGDYYMVVRPLGEGATSTDHRLRISDPSFCRFWLQAGDRLLGENERSQKLVLEVKEISNFEHSKSVGVKVLIVSVDGRYVNQLKWVEEKLIANAEII